MEATIKCVFIGDAGAGKTAINHRFITKQFDESCNTPTIGAIFSCRQLQLLNLNTRVKMQFWDTAGQERFRSIVPIYYRGSAIILIIFDINNRQSFENVKNYWISQIKDEPCFSVFLIGNKKDLNRTVTTNEALSLAEQHGFKYREISAKTDDLEPLLYDIAIDVHQKITTSKVTTDKLRLYGINIDDPPIQYKLTCCGI